MQMRFLVEVLGQPEDQQLQAGLYTRDYFTKEGAAAEGSRWRLMVKLHLGCGGLLIMYFSKPDVFLMVFL